MPQLKFLASSATGREDHGRPCAPSAPHHRLVGAVPYDPVLLLVLLTGVHALLRRKPALAPRRGARGRHSGRRLPSLECCNGFLRWSFHGSWTSCDPVLGLLAMDRSYLPAPPPIVSWHADSIPVLPGSMVSWPPGIRCSWFVC